MRILAFTKIELQHLAEIKEKLLDDRAVEAVLMANVGDLLRGGVVACERGGRIGGHYSDQQKSENQQAEERGNGVERPAQDELQQI